MTSVDDLRRAVERTPATVVGDRAASVAAVVAPRDGELALLLLRRAARDADPWSGNVAFPGGRVEDGEDPFAAAIRETREEVGLTLRPSDALGRLDDLHAVGGRPGMVIRPFLFALDHVPALSLQPAEVADAAWVPLARLLAGDGRGAMEWRRDEATFTLPKVDIGFPVPLWGLTLRMVDDLLHRLDGRGLGMDRTLTNPEAR